MNEPLSNHQLESALGEGYYYDTKRKHFIAQIFLNNKRFYLGSYKTAEEAHNAYLNAKLIYHIIK